MERDFTGLTWSGTKESAEGGWSLVHGTTTSRAGTRGGRAQSYDPRRWFSIVGGTSRHLARGEVAGSRRCSH